MDISKILGGLKDKVLDAGHYELLKNAYDLQQENITQLKNNNSALKESNELFKEKSSAYLEKINQLEEKNFQLSKLIKEQSIKEEPTEIQLSSLASTVLNKIISDDATNFYQNDVAGSTGLGNIEAEAALDELSKHGLISFGSIHHDRGVRYFLTSKANILLTQ